MSKGSVATESKNGTGKSAPLVCRNCGATWDPDDKKAKKDYRRADDGTARCRDARSCRSRKLAVDLDIDLFARYPRELLITLMDRRPPNWKTTGWRSMFTPEVRVGAALIYFSWSFPVSMPYAVQTFTKEDGDEDILRDRYGEPMRHTQRTLADFLNIDQGQVSKAITWRERRKLLRQEDGRIYPEPKPQQLTPQERLDVCTDINKSNLKDLGALSGLSRQIRETLATLLAEAPPDVCTDIKERAKTICTAFNDKVRDARTEREKGARDLCTEVANILGRQMSFSEGKERASGSGAAQGNRPHAPKPPLDGLRDVAAKQLYAGIPAMQEPYPNSAFSKSRFSMGKADLVLVGHILDELKPTGFDAQGYMRFVWSRFKGIDPRTGTAKLRPRSPDDEGGPQSLGLLIDWAGDYAREFAKGPPATPISTAGNGTVERERARYFLDNPEDVPEDMLEWAREILGEHLNALSAKGPG